MDQTQKNWVAKARVLARNVWTGADTQVKRLFKKLQNRYGPRYSAGMAVVVFLSLFSPLPGTFLLAIALVVVVAEVHRAISPRGNFHKAIEGELIMAIKCNVFIKWNSRPDQLRALGAALWRWYLRTAGNTTIYQYVDNQALADLIAGRFPAPGQMSWQAEKGYYFRIQDEDSHDRAAAIDRLRQELPAHGIEDILVNGTSWNLTDQYAIAE